MLRKEFLKTCSFACLGTTAYSVLLQSCISSNYFAITKQDKNQIIVKKTEFVTVNNDKQTPRKYVLVKSEKYNFPICIFKIDEQTYSALLMQCTHKSCELNPQGNYLVCPCHGSEFSNLGKVLNPPAEENLKTFIVKTDDENIYVQV